MALPRSLLRNCIWPFAGFCSLLLFSFVCPRSASAQRACVTFHLWTGPNDRTDSQSTKHYIILMVLALRAPLFPRTRERKQRLSLTQRGKNKEMEEYEISSPPGEFTPQWYLLPHGPALSITHRHTLQVFGEGQAYAKSIGVWSYVKHCELNRFQRCGNRTTDCFCFVSGLGLFCN